MKILLDFLNIKWDKKLPVRVLIYFIGTAISCCGTAIFTLNCLGSDAMNTLFMAIAGKLNVLTGDIYTVFNSIMLIAGFLFAKRYVGIGSIIQILIQGLFINTWIRIFNCTTFLFESFQWKAIMAAVCYVCKCLGIALNTSVCLGTAGFEACLFELADRIQIEYKYLKMASEVIFFGAALFLDGVYGVMTIVEVLFFGHGMSFFMVTLNKTLWPKIGIADERNDLVRNKRGGSATAS